jgi:CheY-like chemotaxis protein
MGRNPTVLVAEDDPNDITFLTLAFKKAGPSVAVHFVQSGREAIQYLQGKRPYADRAHFPLPNLFVVDLKLPGMSGFELLDWVRRQPSLQRIVIGVLSGSDYESDIQQARALGATFYFTKPPAFPELVLVARQLLEKCAAGVPPFGDAGSLPWKTSIKRLRQPGLSSGSPSP